MATDTETAVPNGAMQGRYHAQRLIAASARSALRAENYGDLEDGFLRDIVDAIDGATSGAVWLQTTDKQVEQVASYHFDDEPLHTDPRVSEAHTRLLKKRFTETVPSLTPAGAEVNGVPLPSHVLLAPIQLQGRPRGVLEIVADEGQPASLYKGPTKLLEVIAGVLADWLQRADRYAASVDAERGAEANEFARAVHSALDLDDVCGIVANEARRVVRCDRAAVAVGGSSPRVNAMSSQVTIDRRANNVVALEALLGRVARLGEPLLYDGSPGDLPPQVEEALDRYVDESFVKKLLIYPLRGVIDQEVDAGADPDAPLADDGPVIGAIAFLSFEAETPVEELQSRAEGILDHTRVALSKAVALQWVPLRGVWRSVGWFAGQGAGSALMKRFRVAAVVALAATLVALWPVDFRVRAVGTLEPQIKRGVYANAHGHVEEVLVKHGQQVASDQLLVRLASPDLDVRLADVRGQGRVAEEQALADELKMVGTEVDEVERHRLAGSRGALREQRLGLEKQQRVLEQMKDRLLVESRCSGEVITWDVSRRLLGKPVIPGDLLMTLADTGGPWELELFIDDRRLGHVLQAASENDQPLPVEFILETHATQQLTGRLRRVHAQSQNHADRGWGALVHVDFDRDAAPVLRAGAKVQARVVCGQRSLGFVWFHEIAEWLMTYVFF